MITLWLYRLLWIVASPVALLWFGRRLWRGKETRKRLAERFGKASLPRPQGRLVWFHCASVGEALSILPLVHALLNKNDSLYVLVTTGTVTSARLMAKQLPERAFHQFVPLDFYACVRRFMRHWQPDVSVFVESEFWPELLAQAPCPVLINARMSARSFGRYQKLKSAVLPLLQRFKIVLAQEEADLKRLQILGLSHAQLGGNLKFDALPLPAPHTALKPLKTAIGKRPILVCASTHNGEEEQLFKAIEQYLRPQHPNLLVIIAPRHPERGETITRMLQAAGQNVLQRSKGTLPETKTAYYVADTLGEMGLWYTLAQAVVMGGSFIAHGGQNPLEPLKLGAPVFCGPHMFNFKHMSRILAQHQLLQQVTSAEQLMPILAHTLAKPAGQRAEIATLLAPLTGATALAEQHLTGLLQQK